MTSSGTARVITLRIENLGGTAVAAPGGLPRFDVGSGLLMLASLRQAFFQVADAVSDVGHALFLVADLAFDAQRALVADLLERLEELLDVDLALAQGDFLAPGAGDLRAPGVLHVHAADVG